MISNIRSTNLKEKDFLIQNNLNLMEKLQEWIEFRQKLLKNSYTKEENKEILNKIRKYNTPFEDIKLQTIKRFYEDFDNLFNDVNSSDFEIQCKSRNYKVHKCVLAARSYYFESVFSQETLENQKNILKLDPMIINSEEIFETTLRYFYQGFYGMKKFVFNFEYFNSLLQICNYFDIKCPSFKYF